MVGPQAHLSPGPAAPSMLMSHRKQQDTIQLLCLYFMHFLVVVFVVSCFDT